MNKKNKKISKESYRGVRDLYPRDMAIQNYIFLKMREAAIIFGYEEYNASILEPSELFEAKSGDELGGDQAYKFKDKGNRDVIMRPEMTPTVARMVAKKKRELLLPIRFFSIANIFRYERPQKGRLREHWQLNADIFGVKTLEAEMEIILLAHHVMTNFGAREENFEIKINSRKIMQLLFKHFNFNSEESTKLIKIIDKKEKIKKSDFEIEIEKIAGEKTEKLIELLDIKDFETFSSSLPKKIQDDESIEELSNLLKNLYNLGLKNLSFEPTLARGLDYYTGVVFEIFDKNPENNRSLFGGGRYDNLLELFDSENIPAVGFGMGDITIRDFLETYNLLPIYTPPADVYICTVSNEDKIKAMELAECLRKAGVKAISNVTGKKTGDQIKLADKKNIPFVIFVGKDETGNGEFKIKKLKDGSEEVVTEEEIPEIIKKM